MKKRSLSYAAALGLMTLLILRSGAARAGALRGWELWTAVLIPSLLPFFTAANLLMKLGFMDALGRRLAVPARKLLGLSSPGFGVFLLGLSGGYPLGASAVAEAMRSGAVDRQEATRMLRFCDNTGPAFAVGALGTGVFRSAWWGLALWGAHVLSAAFLARLYARDAAEASPLSQRPNGISIAEALTASVAGAVNSLLAVGGYVIFFSSLLGVSETIGFPTGAAEGLSRLTGADAAALRCLMTGMLELSSGVGAMGALKLSPGNLAMGAFLLSFGGLCVHMQAAAVTAGTGIKLKGRLAGKLLQGLLSAGIIYLAAQLIL
jgi:sporulation integral membrane protein YlbJ